METKSILAEDKPTWLTLITSTGTGVSVLALPAPRLPTKTISLSSVDAGCRATVISVWPERGKDCGLYPIILNSNTSVGFACDMKIHSLLCDVPDLLGMFCQVWPPYCVPLLGSH